MFSQPYPLRFAHCDPAGIAYYPRLFELCDAAIEDWTEACLGIGRGKLHLEVGLGLPTVALTAQFDAASRLGDLLDIAVKVEAVGRTSVNLRVVATCAGQSRFKIEAKQVLIDLHSGRPKAWPSEWRDRLSQTIDRGTSE